MKSTSLPTYLRPARVRQANLEAKLRQCGDESATRWNLAVGLTLKKACLDPDCAGMGVAYICPTFEALFNRAWPFW